MSVSYRLSERVIASALFGARLEEFGVREHVDRGQTSATQRCLTDGHNYLWLYLDDDGCIKSMTRWAGNNVTDILNLIADVCDTSIWSEHEPQYWGFETQEEWDVAWEEWESNSRAS